MINQSRCFFFIEQVIFCNMLEFPFQNAHHFIAIVFDQFIRDALNYFAGGSTARKGTEHSANTSADGRSYTRNRASYCRTNSCAAMEAANAARDAGSGIRYVLYKLFTRYSATNNIGNITG